jgi:two-component system, cell cycle sensor histidine kinase and response regulator CckA
MPTTNSRNRKILEDMQEGYYEIDLVGSFVYVNDIVCSIAEMPREQLIGVNFMSYTSKTTSKKVFRVFNDVFRTGIPQRIEYEIILPSGKKKVIENSTSLLRDEKGATIGFCGLVGDITRRKRLEEQIRESRERFEALFENANELIITTDPYGFVKRINRKIESVSGYTRKEFIGQSILLIAHPEDKDLFIEFWKQILIDKTPRFELRAVAKDGRTEYLLASGSAVKKAGKIVEIQYNVQIITDLKNAQQTIEDLSDRLNSIFESSPNVIICLDKNLRVQMANPTTGKIFHKSASSLLGREISFLSPEMKAFEKVIREIQETRQPQFFHERMISDQSNDIFDVSIYPLMGHGPGGVVFTAVDITEKKHMEIQLIHAQKMETIGELAGGVAHDFNNILTGISGNLAMLKFTSNREKQLGYVETLEKITDRARDLIQQMLVFTKRNEGKPENISIREVIQEVMGMAYKSVPKSISFDIRDIDPGLCVHIDHTQLTQVLLNLIVNAKDAIGLKQRGKISIDAQPVNVDKDMKRQFLLGTTGRYVRIDVGDNGCGMNKDILPKIYDPFFSTKQKGTNKGTGLGLSITYNIIKNAEGSIQVQSEEGKGTRFSVLLPIAKSRQKSAASEIRQSEKLSLQKARVLLVDDEDMLREIGKEMLEYLGHEVDTAQDGYRCIDLLTCNGGSFDIVILDMIMPGLDGYHTLKEMQKRGIQTKVIISSGFSFEHEREELLNNPLIAAKLNKPFNIEELSQVLNDILAG